MNAPKTIACATMLLLTAVNVARAQERGWLGIAISCSNCSWRVVGSKDSWQFSSPPTVEAIAEAGPAARSGIRAGDALIAADGLPLTSEAGARRFSDAQPRQTIALTFSRRGVTHTVNLVAAERPLDRPHASLSDAAGAAGQALEATRRVAGPDSPRRFAGTIAGLGVEVRGSPDVTVLLDERECRAVIVTATHRISLTPPAGCAKQSP